MGNEQDRRVLLAIILSLGVYYVWVSFFAPRPTAQDLAGSDGTVGVESPVQAPMAGSASAGGDAVPGVEVAGATTPGSDDSAAEVPAARVPERKEPVQTEAFTAVIDSSSGGIQDLVLTDYTESPVTHALWSWVFDRLSGRTDAPWTAYTGGDEPKRILGEMGAIGLAGVGAPTGDGPYWIERDGDGWVAHRTTPEGVTITKTLRPGDDPHTMRVEVSFRNGGSRAVDRLWVGVADQMDGKAGRFDNIPRPEALVDDDVEHLLDISDVDGSRVERFDGPVGWFGVGDRYFMAVLAPTEELVGSVVMDTLADGRTGAFMVDGQALAPGETRAISFLAFMGPKELDLLQDLDHDLDKAVEFGFFGFFSRILLFLLKIFYMGVSNWGLAIIALTVLVKAAFFPLTQKAFVSSKKMQALQPQLKELQERYKDNKELQSTETMKLFRENGVSPMGGCLPSLIQLPVWFALYGVMLRSVELYDSSFLYLKDLTAPDPYGVLPVIYAVAILAQQRMMPMGSMDPAQQRVMKMIPLVFAFMMFGFPSGLVLYFSVNIILTVFQQWLINRNHDASQAREQKATP
ncbi:MAG: membrane protein insertase YidC [Deltaproteobacteria bacterium]|nr:MAG: membrane protein insertase YidC [Deltaproteobacteria bacterium]